MKSFGEFAQRSMFVAAGVLVGSLCLAGCSQATPTANPTATSTTSSSASSTPIPSATLPAAMTPAEAKAAYKAFTKASCNKAQNEGVVETGDTYTAVMASTAQGYQDFTAAYFEQPDTYQIIWELDGFNACADWFTFSMADEAGREAAINVTFNQADASFTATQDLGAMGVSSHRFTVATGLIATATNLDPKHATTVSLRYGTLTADDLKILKTAVDRYTATLK
jgi:hypothetical protein